MYMFEQFLATKKPKEITSYDSIIIPFDKYIWLFTFGCICAQFLLLVAMQYLYSHVTGTIIPNDFIYEGRHYYQPHLTYVWWGVEISDIFLSTELIPKRRLTRWIQRPGFGVRKIVILKWMVLGNILTLGYKTTLLSSLIPIRYEDTIDSMDDLDKSGLPLLISKGSSMYDHIASDPREMMTRIFKRRIMYSYENGIPQWAFEM